jgi:hypothetical protein
MKYLTSRPITKMSVSLAEITQGWHDTFAISELGFAVLGEMYDSSVLHEICHAASQLENTAETRFLSLHMLRASHRHIPQVQDLVNSSKRLEYLSQLVGTRLEPYQIDVAASHINYYHADQTPIQFHSDGSALVELIPLDETPGECGATIVYRGPRDEGYARLKSGEIDDSDTLKIPHRFGESILLQGRRLLHSGSTTATDRKLLVISMRSRDEPWKDDNTISRLALDYPIEDFLKDWTADEVERKLPALRAATS